MKKSIPKVALILKKGNKKVFLYPSIRKTKFFLRNKAKSFLKNEYLITIRVKYEDGSINTGSYNKIEDLNWAFQAFVKDYLK